MKIVDLVCSAGRTGFYFDDQRAIKGGAGHDGIFYVGAPVTEGFSAVDEQVTAKSETNLRTAPSTTSSEIVYTLKHGEFVHRVGIHPNGWSKLEYDGKTVYAVTSYLTTETEVEE